MEVSTTQKTIRRNIFIALLVLITAVLALVATMWPLLARLISPTHAVGQVASQDILAPAVITYNSDVLTEQRQESAARAVAPVYTPPDTSVARSQLERLRAVLAYIGSVRADTYSTSEQKMADLAALEDIHLSQETATAILGLSESRWQTVQQEAIVVLEQVMRSTIRADRLEDTRNTVPTLVSLALPDEQASIVVRLVDAFVAPNSLYSETLTEAARQKAREGVKPVSRTYMRGETVVRRGQVLTEVELEALHALGLAQPQQRWQDLASAASLVSLLLAFMIVYLRRLPAEQRQMRSLALLSLLFLSFLLGARLTIPDHTIIPYAYPLTAFSLIVAALFGVELALVSALPLAILAAYGLPNALDLTLYFVIGSLFGVLALGRARRLTSFFGAGLAISISGTIVIVVYRLTVPTTDLVGLASLTGAAVFQGLAAASLTILLQFFLAQFLGMVTPMQLVELTRPDNPLLQRLLRDAPGTYQHSLQVANLAEQAAEYINADTLLTRVGALYHDIGKTMNPVYFIENQVPGFLNPHDDLDPATSANTIIRHVTDGLDVAQKNRLPRRIMEFISEHHGTMLTRYQYVKAVKAAGGDESQVDIEQFRYPGPRPQSRETAILMLADGSEALVRAERPKDEAELRSLIKSVIDNRVSIGELDDTDLTLQDLTQILDSFTTTLRGIYHPRVKYPQLESKTGSEDTIPVLLPQNARQSSDVPLGSTQTGSTGVGSAAESSPQS